MENKQLPKSKKSRRMIVLSIILILIIILIIIYLFLRLKNKDVTLATSLLAGLVVALFDTVLRWVEEGIDNCVN